LATTGGLSEDDALRLAAAVEQDSEHSVARAVVASARERGIEIPRATGFEAIAGRGVRATVDGRALTVGGPNLLAGDGISADGALGEFAERAASRGEAVIYLVEGGAPRAAFAVADAIRPESREAIDRLHAAGIEVVM